MKISMFIILCLFTLGFIAACQQKRSITVDDISGVWVDESGEVLMWMNEDGTFTFANVNSPDTHANFGDFQLEGTKLTLINDDESPWCAGFRSSVQTEFIRGDKLKWTSIEEDCPEPGAVMDETYVWGRYSQLHKREEGMAIEDLVMWLLAPSLLAVSIVLIILGRRKNNRTLVLIGSVVGIGGICFIALLVFLIYIVLTYG